ncbi:MAG TPA: hypothetical protein PLC86_07605, partial [Candidatus Accumulibacter phosphatis]|nr:hypothetical protein [Candidatus Accumulibacter phosphatis]
ANSEGPLGKWPDLKRMRSSRGRSRRPQRSVPAERSRVTGPTQLLPHGRHGSNTGRTRAMAVPSTGAA